MCLPPKNARGSRTASGTGHVRANDKWNNMGSRLEPPDRPDADDMADGPDEDAEREEHSSRTAILSSELVYHVAHLGISGLILSISYEGRMYNVRVDLAYPMGWPPGKN